LALVEGCKHSLEITVPAEEVESETGKVVSSFQAKARLPGFRPGKAPASLIRKQFQGDIRQKVLENLIPRFLQKTGRGGGAASGRTARHHQGQIRPG